MVHYYPDSLIAATTEEPVADVVDVLKNRFDKKTTKVYVCSMGTCKAPVEDVQDALRLF